MFLIVDLRNVNKHPVVYTPTQERRQHNHETDDRNEQCAREVSKLQHCVGRRTLRLARSAGYTASPRLLSILIQPLLQLVWYMQYGYRYPITL